RPAQKEAPPVVEAAAPIEPVELDEPEAESLPPVASAPVDEPEPAIEPAAAVEPETVPTWMARPAAGAPAGVHGLDPTLYAEWADLLGESVELDRDAATRLEEALAEATGGHATSGAWREVVLGTSESLEGASRSRAGRESGQPAGSADSGAAAAGRDPAPPAEAEAVPAGPQPSLDEQLSALGTLAAMGQIDEVAEAYRALLRARADAAQPAIEALTLLVVSHPDSGALHRALGDAYMRAGRFQKAIEAYNRAVASQPQPVAAA
ncbi:MAG TPA: tetratricopeptide repeat protein, partial [Chloroflexota bacterium]